MNVRRPLILASLLLAPAFAQGEVEHPRPAVKAPASENSAALRRSPQAEASRRANQEVRRIVGAYRAGQISRAKAEQELRPHVAAMAATTLTQLDQHIAQTKSRLAELEAARRDPETLVAKRIHDLLSGQGDRTR